MRELDHNIFRYATSELSQDAFICWLLSYAMEDEETVRNPGLKACADDMLRAFYPEEERPAPGRCVVTNIQTQYKKMDALVTVLDDNGECKFIIEDKIGASEHSNQLERYKEVVNREYDGCIRGVYFKSGLQGDLTAVDGAGYKALMRKEILAILAPYAQSVHNDIFRAYYGKLKFDDDEAERFRELPIGQWNWGQIEGFFHYLIAEKRLKDVFSSGYVPNRNGGFIGMWMKQPMSLLKHGVELYVQVEFAPRDCRISLKASVIGEKTLKEPKAIADPFLNACVRGNGMYETLSERFSIKRPSRIRWATYMTIGFLPPAGDEMSALHYEQLAEKVLEAKDRLPDIYEYFASL